MNGNDHDLTVTNCRYHSSQVSKGLRAAHGTLASGGARGTIRLVGEKLGGTSDGDSTRASDLLVSV